MRADQAVDAAAHATGMRAYEIMGRTMVAPVTYARALAMWLLRRDGWSSSAIGAAFDRDHTTVSSACKRIERCMVDEDQRTRKAVEKAESWLSRQTSADRYGEEALIERIASRVVEKLFQELAKNLVNGASNGK